MKCTCHIISKIDHMYLRFFVTLHRSAVEPFASSSVCWNAFVSEKITSATYAAKTKQMANANPQKTFLA